MRSERVSNDSHADDSAHDARVLSVSSAVRDPRSRVRHRVGS